MILPFALAEYLSGARVAPLTSGAFAALAYVTIFPSILAVLFYNRGVQLIGANRSGPFLHLVPLFGVILAIIFLGERPGVHHAIGAVLIIGGVFIAGVSPASDSDRFADPARPGRHKTLALTLSRVAAFRRSISPDTVGSYLFLTFWEMNHAKAFLAWAGPSPHSSCSHRRLPWPRALTSYSAS